MLTFRADARAADALLDRGLWLPLVTVWIAGVGRTWDHQWAPLLRRLGLGSLVYVFVLGTLLWVFSRPLTSRRPWTAKHVVTFVCLTAPPAWLYAIPLEQIVGVDTASQLNMGLLGVVAAWRVALLVWFFRVVGRMSALATFTAAGTPLCVVLFVAVLFDMHYHLAAAMGGLGQAAELGAEYPAIELVGAIGLAGFMCAPFAFGLWAMLAAWEWTTARRRRIAGVLEDGENGV